MIYHVIPVVIFPISLCFHVYQAGYAGDAGFAEVLADALLVCRHEICSQMRFLWKVASKASTDVIVLKRTLTLICFRLVFSEHGHGIYV